MAVDDLRLGGVLVPLLLGHQMHDAHRLAWHGFEHAELVAFAFQRCFRLAGCFRHGCSPRSFRRFLTPSTYSKARIYNGDFDWPPRSMMSSPCWPAMPLNSSTHSLHFACGMRSMMPCAMATARR